MNHRIRELAEEATRKYDRLGNEIPFAQPDLELFAELIIRECAGVIEDAVDHREPASTYVGKIKDYFDLNKK